MKTELISIIMNCYNGEKFIEKSINSIISQDYKNWELIFWNNLSNDKTEDIYLKLRSNDSRLKYFKSTEHLPLSVARNLAVAKIQGEFIAFLDVDDWWEPFKLSEQIKLFKDKSIGLVYGNFYVNNFTNKTAIYGFPPRKVKQNEKIVMFNTKLPEGYILNKLLQRYVIGMMTIIIRRNIIEDINKLFDEDIETIQDFDLAIRISKKNKILCCQKPIAHKRLHENNKINVNRKIIINEMEFLLNKYRKDLFYESKYLDEFEQYIILLKCFLYIRQLNFLKFLINFLKLKIIKKINFQKLIIFKIYK